MEQGNDVGFLTTQHFPGGVLIDFARDRMQEMVEATRQALAEGAPAIFEASFFEDGVFVAVDVLERLDEGFRVIEVKSSSSVKEQHIPDVAIQVHVLRKAGLDVREAALMHLNKGHRHPDQGDLFVRADVMAKVEAFLPEVPDLIREYRTILDGPDPGACLGDQCARNRECPLDAACWPQEPDHIRKLHGVGAKTALKYMRQNVHHFGDLPEDAKVPAPAQRQLEAWEQDRMLVEPGLAADLEPFRGRVGFLDFETVARAIPMWEGMKPWQTVTVQFSYHERQPDGTYTHAEWLADGWEDPQPALARALVEATRGAERVAMYTTFERDRIRELAEAVPELAAELQDLEARLVDLKKVIQDNVAHPDFLGSYSIKDVLTPLVPELSYTDLEVSGGMTASVEIARLITHGHALDDDELAAKRAALLEYCKLDTWAMVRLVERLEELAMEMTT
jgi:hypothetical protein